MDEDANGIVVWKPVQRCGVGGASGCNEIANIDLAFRMMPSKGRLHSLEVCERGEAIDLGLIE